MATNNVSIIKDKCFGCTACASICPVQAIEMKQNREGFLYPVVDDTKCISCGKCRKTCPAQASEEAPRARLSHNKMCAFINDNENVLLSSTSGAFFSAAVEAFSPEYVCGAILDKDLKVVHVVSSQHDTIGKMRGSKYVQSDLGQCFTEIQGLLAAGNRVLFSGTSCQVQGLINYLDLTKTNTENLLTLDLVCHGVPSPKLFHDYLENYKAKTGKEIVSYSSRSKAYGWGIKLGVLNYLQTVASSDNQSDSTSFDANLWQNIFFSDYCIRECCYSCPFAKPDKPADLTMGDFWGAESIVGDIPYKHGCSLIICHTEKGYALLEKMAVVWLDNTQMVEAVNKQTRLKKPIDRPSDRDAFWQDYYSSTFSAVAERYFRYTKRNGLLMRVYIFLVRIGLHRPADLISRKLFF